MVRNYREYELRASSWNNVETPDCLRYKFFPIVQKFQSFFVKIKTSRGACIALTTELQEAGPIYEVILGDSDNTISLIKKNRKTKAEIKTPKILDPDNLCTFWITWENGVLFVRSDETPVITWTDPEPFRIVFVGICTKGDTGSWQIENVETAGPNWQFYPVFNNKFKFQVKTNKEAYIALTGNPTGSGPIYEVMIERKDYYTEIRKNKDSKYWEYTYGFLDGSKFINFWITWKRGEICVGCEERSLPEYRDQPFLTWTDPDPFPVFFVGIAGLSKARWKFDALPAYPHKMPRSMLEGTWVNASNGQVPPGAVIGGEDRNGGHAYVARVKRDLSTIPGKLIPSEGCICFAWAGREYRETNYQVLVRSPSNKWIITSFNHIPIGACPGGKTKDGKVLYIGRVQLDNGDQAIGTVPEPDGFCYVMVDGKELKASRYEILMS